MLYADTVIDHGGRNTPAISYFSEEGITKEPNDTVSTQRHRVVGIRPDPSGGSMEEPVIGRDFLRCLCSLCMRDKQQKEEQISEGGIHKVSPSQ